MKIRHKLTLRYTGITTIIFSLFILTIYLFSEQNREKEFYRDLTREAVTKANLFLGGGVDAPTMQSIYHNNRKFIDEVEVAVYTTDFVLLYHDAQDIDIIKETPELIQTAIKKKRIEFYEDAFQGIAMIYTYENSNYVITAAAYDGYGYAKLSSLTILLVILWGLCLATLATIGYLLSRSALRPVSEIIDEVDAISESNLGTRLIVKEEHDELDELSQTFNLMLDRLEKSFNNQKMFVSNVSHELRTPLAALITELEISQLREQRTEDEYKSIITNVLNDANVLKHLITGLIDLAKADYDLSQITTVKLRLDELLLDVRETILKAGKKYSVKLIFDQSTEDDSMITVKGNEYLLKIAFANLIENNCKFSDNKSSFIQISFFSKNAIVRFSDTGVGIPQEEIDNVFIPFYRGANNKYAKGLGIGMALTQKIVLLHNGIITIRSHTGEGTTFIVEIPHI